MLTAGVNGISPAHGCVRQGISTRGIYGVRAVAVGDGARIVLPHVPVIQHGDGGAGGTSSEEAEGERRQKSLACFHRGD